MDFHDVQDYADSSCFSVVGAGGGKWLFGWVTENRDCLATMARSSGKASLNLWGPEDFPFVCVHLILRYEAVVAFLYRYQSSAL